MRTIIDTEEIRSMGMYDVQTGEFLRLLAKGEALALSNPGSDGTRNIAGRLNTIGKTLEVYAARESLSERPGEQPSGIHTWREELLDVRAARVHAAQIYRVERAPNPASQDYARQ